ncbi:hypothetical protein SteCoe_19745 [Stentor coeruleus]|uniref:Uncharacterized protein n=1 Tax=Stentor coeruleus TaxID=5963 RepID=A0A1R2BTV3_9CILI|nr:hypothetical protein SteCoe_19745 [Stentor coeruleus]
MIEKLETTKISEISELKEVIKDYKNVINQAKSLQSLKKCYQSFKKHQQIRAKKIREKICCNISNVIKPNLKTIDNFEFFPMLITNKQTKIPIRIPCTLYCTGSSFHLILYEKHIEIHTGSDATSKFLSTLPSISCMPICLFKPYDGKIKLFCNLSSLKNFIKDHPSTKGYYQHFILPNGHNASILVVHAKLNSYLNSYIIKNTLEIPKRDFMFQEKKKSLITNPECDKVLAGYLQSTMSKYEPISGTLRRQLTFEFPALDSSSAAKLDYPPQIKNNKKYRNLIQRIKAIDHYRSTYGASTPKFPQDLNDIYLVNLRKINALSAYTLKAVIPIIEQMSNILYFLIAKKIRKDYFREPEEMSFIFIRDQEKGWNFLRVDRIQCLNPFEYEETEINTQIHERTHSILLQDLSVLLNASFLAKIEKKSESSESEEKNIKIRSISHIKAKSCFQNFNDKKLINLDEKVTKYINKAAYNFDRLKYKARIAKGDGLAIDKKYSALEFWKEFSIKVQKDIIKSDISRYFVGFTNEKFYNVSRYFYKVFCSDIDCKAKKRIKDVHKDMMISFKDFDVMKKIYLFALDGFGIEDEDIKFISMSFESLRCIIVSDYDN